MHKVGQSEPLDLIRNPVGRWIGLRCSELSLWSVRRKDGSRPLDLGPITRPPSDRTGAVRGLPSGVQPSTYRDSQGQENRDTSSLETPGRSGPSIGGNTWRRSKHRESEYRHSRGQGVGEIHSENPGTNPSHPVWETGVRNLKRVGIFDIGKSGFLRSKELGHHKSRNPGGIRTVHQRGRVEDIGVIGESPDRESSIGVWGSSGYRGSR
jgi:hypothetical protein